jgi:hypothetical protein
MALTTRANGQQITIGSVNDFKDALTGVMTDQAYALNYRPGGAGAVPTLLLKQNGNAPLLKGLKSDDTTQAFLVDQNGALTIASDGIGATWTALPGAVPGSTTTYLQAKVSGNATGRVSLGIRSDGSGNIRLGNSGISYVAEVYTDGTGLVSSVEVRAPSYKGSTGGPAKIAVYDNGTGTLRTITLYEGTTDPATYATPVEGDWWLKG